MSVELNTYLLLHLNLDLSCLKTFLTLKSYTLDSEIKWIKHRKRKGFQLTYSVYSFSQPGITFN